MFGQMLRAHRQRLAFTQDQLAPKSGLSARHVRDLEAGRIGGPRPGTLHLLADALGLDGRDRERFWTTAIAGWPVPVGPVPVQLPSAVDGFTGRAAEIAELDRTTARAVTISGSAGMGKTALAVHWARRVVDRFPDGQLYVDLRGFDPGGSPMTSVEAIRGFLEALGVPVPQCPTEPAAQIGMYHRTDAGSAGQRPRRRPGAPPLLPGASGCLVLITSRHALTGLIAAEAARPIPLGLLTIDEARDLLAQRLGADRTAAEPGAVDMIAARCARLPLALAVAAARAAAQPDLPLAVLADDLRDGDRLDTLSTGDASTDVRSVFSWSYRALSPAAARLFRLLGLHPAAEFSAAAAASLVGLPAARVRPALAELIRAHLVSEPAPGRYALHDLLHEYAGRLPLDEPSDAATGRMLEHYLQTARAADRLLEPARDPVPVDAPCAGVTVEAPADHLQAMRWFTVEHRILLAAADQAARTGLDPYVWLLAEAVATFLYRRGRWHDQVTIQRHALHAATRTAYGPAQARAHIHLARTYCGCTSTTKPRRTCGTRSSCTESTVTRVGRPRHITTSARCANNRADTPKQSATASRRSPCAARVASGSG